MKFTSPFGVYFLLSKLSSLLIVVQSLLTRLGFIALSKWLKFTSNSQRIRFMTLSVFSVYFINYGILYLIAPLHISVPLASRKIRGIYTDFN